MTKRVLTRGPARSLLGVAILLVALAFATGVFANLTNSPFDAGDGNLVLDDDPGTVGNEDVQDWENAPNFMKTIDKLQGQGDNAFGEGTSEDDPVPSIKMDSIPPNKSDITRFYEAHESLGNTTFLYLAWERINVPNGTTNFDFELNQSKTLSTNGQTPVRTAGDILINYDLSSGGTHPTLGYHRWITSSPQTAQQACESNSKFPCWDKVHQISGTSFEASVNTGSVTDPIAPNNPRTLSPYTFGETAIDLVGAGILTAGDCTGFASAYLKSRSSDAFNSAIKDFASPVNADINTCKPVTINLKKVDSDGNPLAGAVMQLFKDANGNGTLDAGIDTQVGSDCTTGADGIGTCSFTLPGASTSNGTYIGHERTPPPGYTSSAPDQTQVVTIDGSTHTFTLTFSDSLAPGKLLIHKVDDAGNPLANAVFTLFNDVAPIGGTRDTLVDLTTGKTCTTDGAGDCTISSVLPGDYWVVETTTPPSYDTAPEQSVHVPVGSSPGEGATVTVPTFVDPRKHVVIVLTCHQGSDTLVSSDVTIDGTTKPSLPAGSLTRAQQKALCDTGGARFAGISGHPTKSASITVGKVGGVEHG